MHKNFIQCILTNFKLKLHSEVACPIEHFTLESRKGGTVKYGKGRVTCPRETVFTRVIKRFTLPSSDLTVSLGKTHDAYTVP